jgi:dihydroorotase/N-acyl-D-amino-acid deacylase
MQRPWTGALENYFHTLGASAILLAGFGTPANAAYEGWRLSDIAAERGQEPAECFADLMIDEGGAITVVLFQTDIEGMKTALAWPHTIVGSDGLPREDGYVHPRLFGTFPRVLARYAGENAAVSRHDAVHRMTGATARRFGLASGVIAPGAPASFQIIDPAVYTDRADFSFPREETAGLEHVFLSGRRVSGAGAVVTGGGRLRRSHIGATL